MVSTIGFPNGFSLCMAFILLGMQKCESLESVEFFEIENEGNKLDIVNKIELVRSNNMRREMLDQFDNLSYNECDEWDLELRGIHMDNVESENILCFNYILEKKDINATNVTECNMSNSINHLMVSFPNTSLSIDDLTNKNDDLMEYYNNRTQCDTIQLHDIYKIFYSAIPNQVSNKYFNINDYPSNLGFTIEYVCFMLFF